jgi:hypothetical protein
MFPATEDNLSHGGTSLPHLHHHLMMVMIVMMMSHQLPSLVNLQL